MELLKVIQEIVQRSLKAAQLTEYVAGTVESVSPLMVRISSTMPPLQAPSLLLTEQVENRLEAGDAVIMLRVQRGQRYIILSRAVGAT